MLGADNIYDKVVNAKCKISKIICKVCIKFEFMKQSADSSKLIIYALPIFFEIQEGKGNEDENSYTGRWFWNSY